MPTIRIDKKPSGNYLSLIQSYRDHDGTPRMRTLANLGKVEDFKGETLKRVSKKLYALAGGDPEELKDNQIKELSRYNFGYVQLIHHLVQYYGLNHLCDRIKRKHHLQYDINGVLELLLIERFNDPCSKLANYHHQQEYFGLGEVKLHWLYRTLDRLDQYSEAIQDLIFTKGRHLFNQKLDIVFYDVTTFYFDSEIEKEEALRQKGFSKDGKIGKTQIVFGMLIDQHKQPVGYEIFQGSTFEGATLKTALEHLQKRYCLQRIIVVADRGMLSKANIALVSDQLGMSYIFGERLKNTAKAVQEIFLDKSKYDKEWIYDKNGQSITIQYYAVYLGEKRIISTYSKKRAAKDKHQRELRIQKAYKLLKDPSKLSAKARYHYLKKEGEQTYKLNEAKIKADEKFDGILAISTNVDELTEIEILDQYRHLFKIEQSFRTMKTLLEVRPMFHWTDKRIRGHVCMCFISLAMLRNTELRLNKAGHHWPENKIIKVLDRMQLSQIEQNGETYFLRSKIETDQQTLAKVFKLRKIKPISHKNLTIR